MLIYERHNQKGVIYDGEREDLLPEWARILARVNSLPEDVQKVKDTTLWDLDRVLSMYL
jgi:hypothetical protein